MTHLRRLGFADDTIFPCHTLTSGQLLVPATIEGEGATLLLDTELRLDVNLDRPYVERRGMPYDPRDEDSGRASTGEFTALGRQREHAIANAVAADRAWWKDDGTHAGRMGVLFFAHGILALDPAAPRIAFTTDDAVRAWPVPPDVRLPLVGGVQDCVPFTRAVALPSLEGDEATFQLDTGRSASLLSLDYLQRATKQKRAAVYRKEQARDGSVLARLTLPGGRALMQRLHLAELAPDAFDHWGVPRYDGVLGRDFLRRWVSVWDLPRSELLLWNYPTLGAPEPDAGTLWRYVRGTPPPRGP